MFRYFILYEGRERQRKRKIFLDTLSPFNKVNMKYDDQRYHENLDFNEFCLQFTSRNFCGFIKISCHEKKEKQKKS